MSSTPSSRGASQRRWRDERGASVIEYAFLVALIAVVCVAAVTFFGSSLSENVSTSGREVDEATS